MNKRIFSFKVAIVLFFLFGGYAARAAEEITILFTHDLHSMFLPHRWEENGETAWRGGYARLCTAIREARKQYPYSVLVDAGDFSSGSFFYMLFPTDCAELQLMWQMGYDAVTLGNHDFDFGPAGLADALRAARQAGVAMPVVTANVKASGTSVQRLREAFENYGVSEYTVFERGGRRIGVFGIIGDEAVMNAPAAVGVLFEDRFAAAARVVQKLRSEEKVDLVVCLSHSGTDVDRRRSEDEQLAAAVPDIDVIVSGHTHSVLQEPLRVGRTFIVSGGCYAAYLGVLTLFASAEAAAERTTEVSFRYRLIPIDSTVGEDAEVAAMIGSFKERLNVVYFDSLGRYMDDTVTFNPSGMPAGRLIAEALRCANHPAFFRQRPVAVVPAGVVRGGMPAGWLTEEAVFSLLSLGVGHDRKAGYPLILVYLTGKELWDLCEVDASCAALFPAARLSLAGLRYSHNPHRLFCNRVTEVWVETDEGEYAPPDKKALYPVVGDLYSLQMLGAVRRLTYGILQLQPKDAAGQRVEDFQKCVLTLPNGLEYKEWIALSDYLRTFPDRRLPSGMVFPEQCQVADDSSLAAWFAHPNGFAWMVYGIVPTVAGGIIGLIVFGIRRMRKRGRRLLYTR
ncbi:MAG: metallophosphoesterase [Prevotellaceae bacterium]|jgi:2',3'-cyclic-nucleotide 2'-phosphodiesterase (5'-nucleotidase family)|nr:metallophosphoesterase [Prevotellaceae bacterium]